MSNSARHLSRTSQIPVPEPAAEKNPSMPSSAQRFALDDYTKRERKAQDEEDNRTGKFHLSHLKEKEKD